jgi:hypothetical protein
MRALNLTRLPRASKISYFSDRLLAAIARADGFEVFTHPRRICLGAAAAMTQQLPSLRIAKHAVG